MRSRVLTLADPRAVDLAGILQPFALDQKKLDRELQRLLNPYIRWEKGTTVSPGDVVVCKLSSPCPRFQRDQVQFVAGSGMFQRDLEALCIGMSVGETRETTLPEGAVSVTLLKVTNKIVPALTDEMVEKLELPEAHTVEEYRAYLMEQQREEQFWNVLYEPQHYLIDQMIAQSEFVLYQEDWQHVVDLRLERLRAISRHEGMVLEEMTPEQFEGRIPVKSYFELVAMEQASAWKTLCMHLIGRCFAQETGFAPREAEYEKQLQEEQKAWGYTEEAVREINTYSSYEFFAYYNLALQTLNGVIREQFNQGAC